MNHEIVFLAQRCPSLRGVKILGEERVNVINDDSLASYLIALLIDVSRLKVRVGHLHVLGALHTLHDLLDESDLVLCLHPLEATDEVLVTLPRFDLLETIEVEQPFIVISKDVGDQVCEKSVRTLDPLTRIDSAGYVLETLR